MAVKVSSNEIEIILLPGGYGVAYGGADYYPGDIFTADKATATRLINNAQAREATDEDKAEAVTTVKKGKK